MKIILCLLVSLAALSFAEHLLIPRPLHMTTGTQFLRLSRCALEVAKSSDAEFGKLLGIHKGIFSGPDAACSSAARPSRRFVLSADRLPGGDREKCQDESYTLDVTESGVHMAAKCPVGIVRAVATLYQLVQFPKDSNEMTVEAAPIHVEDSPRFKHRGVMVDTSRHYIKKTILARIIDGMMLSKLNVFHWHIIDDDSYPMQSKQYPGLSEAGAFSPQLTYTAEDIKEIVEYAEARGVRVMPELENPGHTRSLGLYKPLNNLVTCFNKVWPYEVPDVYQIRGGPSTGALDPSMDESYEYMRKILTDLTSYFTDELVHLGGDEVMEACWDERPEIRKFMKKNGLTDFYDLMSYYIKRVKGVLAGVNSKKTPVYWANEEQFKIRHEAGEVLQFWGESKNIKKLTTFYPRNKFILSPWDFLYLDCGFENPFGGYAWCGDYKTWASIYSFEPTNYGLSEDKILGSEACAWSELNNNDNLENKLWPRIVSLGETLWEPKRTKEANLTSLVTRLNAFTAKLNSVSIRSAAITGQYCEINTKECFQKWT